MVMVLVLGMFTVMAMFVPKAILSFEKACIVKVIYLHVIKKI